LCLLLILLALLALVLARRRNDQRRKMRKLIQPDYAELAYGDVENLTLAKRKAEVLLLFSSEHHMSVRSLTPVQHYEKLEKLLLAENGRLAHAMFVSVSPTSAEKVRLSLSLPS
jgi:hypothetical protein